MLQSKHGAFWLQTIAKSRKGSVKLPFLHQAYFYNHGHQYINM